MCALLTACSSNEDPNENTKIIDGKVQEIVEKLKQNTAADHLPIDVTEEVINEHEKERSQEKYQYINSHNFWEYTKNIREDSSTTTVEWYWIEDDWYHRYTGVVDNNDNNIWKYQYISLNPPEPDVHDTLLYKRAVSSKFLQ